MSPLSPELHISSDPGGVQGSEVGISGGRRAEGWTSWTSPEEGGRVETPSSIRVPEECRKSLAEPGSVLVQGFRVTWEGRTEGPTRAPRYEGGCLGEGSRSTQSNPGPKGEYLCWEGDGPTDLTGHSRLGRDHLSRRSGCTPLRSGIRVQQSPPSVRSRVSLCRGSEEDTGGTSRVYGRTESGNLRDSGLFNCGGREE